jgi:hypothetical protein
MLAKRPEGRFQLPDELSAALVACMAQLGIAAPQSQAMLLPYGSAWTWGQTGWRWHAPWLVPAALLLLSVLALELWLNQGQEQPTFPELRISGSSAPSPNTLKEPGEGG